MSPSTAPAPGNNNSNRTIEIIVGIDGQLSLQTRGFRGPSCRDASRFIEQALGQRLAEQATPEFHRAQAQEQRVQQSG